MTGEERDQIEHREALKRFGNKMPFSPTYTPECCLRHGDRSNTQGNLRVDSAKWDQYLEEAFGKTQSQGPQKPPKTGRRFGSKGPGSY